MTMSFLPFDPSDTITITESVSCAPPQPVVESALLHIPREKIGIPSFEKLVVRPRVLKVLKQSESQFPATLVCGRSGTGKSALVASFASNRKGASWVSLEPPDMHWASFAHSTLTSVRGVRDAKQALPDSKELLNPPETKDISKFVDGLFSRGRKRRSLLVLDNIHYLFDTPWFRSFFELLLPSIPDSTHVMMIARSKPPFPTWRMRSKQYLNVIEEKVFAFDEAETVELFRETGLPVELAGVAHQNCFGKVSQMLNFARSSDEAAII